VSLPFVRDLDLKLSVKRAFSHGSFGRQVGVLALGTSVGQLAALAGSPVLTRLYSAEQFGQMAAFTAVLLFFGAILSLRYEIAILLPEDNHTAANVLVLSLIIVVFLSLMTGLVLPLVPNWGGPLAQIRSYLWLMPVAAFGLGFYQALSYWALRNKAYSQVARTKLTQPLSRLATQIVLGIFKWGALGLLVGETVGRINGGTSLAWTAWRENKHDFQAVTWAGLRSVAARYRRFPLVLSPAALINAAGSSVPILLVGLWFGPRVLGWYALVDRTMAMPTVLIGQAVSQVYSAEAARLATTDPNQLNLLFNRTVAHLSLIAFVPALILGIIAAPLFSFVFGSSWHEAGVYAQLLVMMQFLGFVSWPVNPTLSILECQSIQLAWDIGRGGLAILTLAVCHVGNLGPRQTILAYGCAMSAAYLMHLALSKWGIRVRVRYHSNSASKVVVPSTAQPSET